MLPNITRTLLDGNLDRPASNQQVNRRILIIGTAEDGPVYEPTLITDLRQVVDVFGRFGQGSLVRSITEAWNAQSGSQGQPQIYAVRLGNKYAKKAFLNISDTGTEVLKLEALYPGDIYNDISVLMEGIYVKIYNPKSETWSSFMYSSDTTNTVADVHSISELADKINADPNLNTIMIAAAVEKEANFELNVSSTDTDVLTSVAAGSTVIDISGMDQTDLVSTNRYLDKETNTFADGDENNTITAIEAVYAIGESDMQEHEVAGLSSIKLERQPLDGKNDDRFGTLLNASSDSATVGFPAIASNPQDTVTPEAYLRHKAASLGTIMENPASAGNALYVFTVNAPLGLAHNDTVSASYAASLADNDGTDYDATYRGYDLVADVATYVSAPDSSEYDDDEQLIIELNPPNAGSNDWSKLYSDQATQKLAETTDFTVTWADGVLTVTIASDTLKAMLDANIGGQLRISFDSCIGMMEEKTSLSALQASGATFKDYFVRGNEIMFGAPAPANMVFRHTTLTYYDLGSTLEVVDASVPKLKLIGTGNQPGPGGGAIGTADVILGFKYSYSPDWYSFPTLTFSNGTNGTNLTNNQLYEELEAAYNRLDDFNMDILVVPGAYLDATKTGYNALTGLPQSENAGFHTLMSNFLSGYNGEAVGVIGFKPLVGTGINHSITRGDVALRAMKLTETDASDPLRAANFLVPFQQKFMLAVDAEPIFTYGGSRYTTTAEAAVAGHFSTLKPNESIYLDSIAGISGLRYKYSDKMVSGASQLNALSDARVIAAIESQSGGIRLTDGPTLADPGSDYERLTTVWIVRRAMEITRGIARDYLGRPSSMEILQALETRLRSELSTMVPNELRGFNFQIKSDPRQRVVGRLEIILQLVPVFEIRSISVPVTLLADESALASFA